MDLGSRSLSCGKTLRITVCRSMVRVPCLTFIGCCPSLDRWLSQVGRRFVSMYVYHLDDHKQSPSDSQLGFSRKYQGVQYCIPPVGVSHIALIRSPDHYFCCVYKNMNTASSGTSGLTAVLIFDISSIMLDCIGS